MTALRALALLGALALAGCGSWNPLIALGIRSEPANKPTPLAKIDEKVSLKPAWSASVGKSGDAVLVPHVEAGRIYAASADGTLTVLDEDTGKVVSQTHLKKPVSGGVELADGRVLLGTIKGEVLALDPAGKMLWKSQVAGEVIAPPAVAKKVVVVRTSDGRILGLDEEDGKRKWVYQRPPPALLLRTSSGVLAAGGDILVGYPNGKLIALDADDGKLTWEATVAQPRGTTELERIADVGGLPVIDGSTVCAAAFQGKVACFDIQTRNMLWSKDISSSTALAKDAKNYYVVGDNGAVQALDKATGASAWSNEKLLYRRLTEPVATRSLILVGDAQGYLHALSPDDGALIGRMATDGSPIHAIVPVTGGVLVQTAKGQVSLIRL